MTWARYGLAKSLRLQRDAVNAFLGAYPNASVIPASIGNASSALSKVSVDALAEEARTALVLTQVEKAKVSGQKALTLLQDEDSDTLKRGEAYARAASQQAEAVVELNKAEEMLQRADSLRQTSHEANLRSQNLWKGLLPPEDGIIGAAQLFKDLVEKTIAAS